MLGLLGSGRGRDGDGAAVGQLYRHGPRDLNPGPGTIRLA